MDEPWPTSRKVTDAVPGDFLVINVIAMAAEEKIKNDKKEDL